VGAGQRSIVFTSLDWRRQYRPPLGPTLEETSAAVAASSIDAKRIEINPRHHSSDYLETIDYNKAVTDLRREILDDASKRLAKSEFKGDKVEARRVLKGGDISGHPTGRQERIKKSRTRFR
jgi:hypothetical protein